MKTGPQNSKTPSHIHVICFVLCFGLSLVIYSVKWDLFRLGTFMDDASYAVLAQSFIYSHQYGFVNSPGDPMPTRYPFGFPLLLSPIVYFCPDQPEALKIVALGATLINLLLIFFGWPWLSPGQSYWRALGITALYAVSPQTCLYTRMVMSEPVFLMYTLVALILAERLSGIYRNYEWWCLGLGVVGIYLYFLRTIGIVAFGVLGIRLVGGGTRISIKKISYLIFGAIVTASLVLVLTSVSIGDYIPREYLEQLIRPEQFGSSTTPDAAARIIPNAEAYMTHYLARLSQIPGKDILSRCFGSSLPASYGGFLLVGILVTGFISLWKQQHLGPGIALFTILYGVVLLVWPWASERFLYPIIPFVMMFYLEGIFRAITGLCLGIRWLRPRSQHVATVCTTLCVASILFVSISRAFEDTGSLKCTPDFTIGPRWLLQHSPPSSIIMAQLPQIVFLYSQRKTVQNGWYYKTPEQLIEALRRDDVDYLLIAPELRWDCSGKPEIEPFVTNTLLPMLDFLIFSGHIRLVFYRDSEKIRIYEVIQ